MNYQIHKFITTINLYLPQKKYNNHLINLTGLQYRVSCGDAGVRVQVLRGLPNEAASAEGDTGQMFSTFLKLDIMPYKINTLRLIGRHKH